MRKNKIQNMWMRDCMAVGNCSWMTVIYNSRKLLKAYIDE